MVGARGAGTEQISLLMFLTRTKKEKRPGQGGKPRALVAGEGWGGRASKPPKAYRDNPRVQCNFHGGLQVHQWFIPRLPSPSFPKDGLLLRSSSRV